MVHDAIQTLFESRVLALPVFNEDDQCIGAIDLLTVLQYPLRMGMISGEDDVKNNAAYVSAMWDAVRELPIGAVLESAPKTLVPFYIENPVSMLIDLFSTGVHRVALFSTDKRVISTCSQSDVTSFLCALYHQALAIEAASAEKGDQEVGSPLPNPVSTTSPAWIAAAAAAEYMVPNDVVHAFTSTDADALGLLKAVDSVSVNVPVFEALRRLAETGRRALAVVDHDGRLVADFSTSDLHNLPSANFDSLASSLGVWLQSYSPESLRPICTTASSNIGQLVDAMVAKRHHRLWVLDDQGKPQSVISLTDILSLFATSDRVDARTTAGDFDLSSLWSGSL